MLSLHKQRCLSFRIWSHLLKKSFMEDFIFCAVFVKREANWNIRLKFTSRVISDELFVQVLHGLEIWQMLLAEGEFCEESFRKKAALQLRETSFSLTFLKYPVFSFRSIWIYCKLFCVIKTERSHQNKFLKINFQKIFETTMTHNVKYRPRSPQIAKNKCGDFHTS